ncbi:hypothetical protein ACIBO2_09385 [Nonomuraea sp. NPDC050022]|uniref:hypothetical protein n=1 Tax=Nonomuraea sp. NPDC050022 TaxID=3364358 RepID=UPI00378A0FA8
MAPRNPPDVPIIFVVDECQAILADTTSHTLLAEMQAAYRAMAARMQLTHTTANDQGAASDSAKNRGRALHPATCNDHEVTPS